MVLTAIVLLTAFFVLDLLGRLLAIRVIVPIFESPPPLAFENYPADAGIEQFQVNSSGGLTLRGAIFRGSMQPARGLIVFCPELGGNRWSVPAYCQGLLEAGFDVVSFDFRNQGDSAHLAGYQPLHWLTEFEVDDVLAVIRYTRARTDLCDLKLGLFGISRGGSAALVAAARCGAVACVAADGAFSSRGMLVHFTRRWGRLYFPEWVLQILPPWHLRMTVYLVQRISGFRKGCVYANVEGAMRRLRQTPVLMISGERDSYVFPASTRRLFRRTGQGEDRLWIVPEAKHNMARRVATVEYDRRLVEFFGQLAPRDTEPGLIAGAPAARRLASAPR